MLLRAGGGRGAGAAGDAESGGDVIFVGERSEGDGEGEKKEGEGDEAGPFPVGDEAV